MAVTVNNIFCKSKKNKRILLNQADVHTITLERALALLAAPKKSRRSTMTRTVLRTLGAHPQGGAEVTLMDGRYGPYVTDGQTNASLPKTADPAALTLSRRWSC